MYLSIILIYCLEVVCSFLFNVSCLLLLFLLGGCFYVCVCVFLCFGFISVFCRNVSVEIKLPTELHTV